jgi:hypothetical protein
MTETKARGPRWPLILLAALLAASLLIAACGGDDDDASSDDADTEPTATRMAENETSDATAEPSATEAVDNTGDSGSESAVVDACSLLTSREVQSVLGVPVEPANQDVPPIYSCRWEAEDATALTFASVSVYSAASAGEAAAYYDSTSSSEGNEPVEGLGDRAYWANPPFNFLEILDGNYDLSVTVTYPGDDSRLLAEKLAREALRNLP